MRLGLIARGDSRGLGIQCKSFHDAMRPDRTLVVNCPSAQPLPVRRDWYPDAAWIDGWPTAELFRRWLDGLDVVYSAETFYSNDLPVIADRMGVKTVLHINFEFLEHVRNPNLPQPTLFAVPSMWRWKEIPDPKAFLPVPIELDRFPQRPRPVTATHFLHVIGRPAVHDRNGTTDLLEALQYVRSTVTVTIRCQDPRYVPPLLSGLRIPDNCTLNVQSGDVPNYWDMYDADVLVMPRRFGGLCLPCNEALGAQMPVIMPDISPNNTWLPAEWLVPAVRSGQFMARNLIDVHRTDAVALAAKIDQFATDDAFYGAAVERATILAKELSWDQLKPEYDRVFVELVGKVP